MKKHLQSYKVTSKGVILHISTQFLNSLKHFDWSFGFSSWNEHITIFLI